MARWLIIIGVAIPTFGVPTFGILFNLLCPPKYYAYFGEMTLLLLFALVALWLHRASLSAAVFFYCVSVQLSLLADVERAHRVNGTWSIFVLGPFVGLLIVAALLKDQKMTIAFAGVAVVINCIVGILCSDIGNAVALCTLSVMTSIPLIAWCRAEAEKREALKTLEIIQKGLAGTLEL